MGARDRPRVIDTIDKLLGVGALAPPAMKSRTWLRVWRRLSRGVSGRVMSNLGIDRKLRWEVPLIAPIEAFGRPLDEPTDRGAIGAARAFADPSLDFLDVGANRGVHSLAVAPWYRRVIAIEPDPELAAVLRQNLARNGLSTIEVIEAAVSDRCGTARFMRNLDNPLMGTLETNFAAGHRRAEVDVSLITIDELVARWGIDRFVAKIDVEGHGLCAIRGVGSAMARCEALVVEITASEVRDGVVQYLIDEGGWRAYYIVDRDLRPSLRGEFEYVPSQLNWLFCRLDGSQLAEKVRPFGLSVAASS